MIDTRLLREAKHVIGFMGGNVILGVGLAFLTIAQAYLLSQVIGRVFLENASLTQVRSYLLGILGIILLRGVIQFVSEILARETAIRVKEKIRIRLLKKITALGPIYVRGERAGELLNTAIEGVEALDDYFAKYIPQLILAIIVPIIILAIVLPKDIQSALVFLITGPLIPFFMLLIGKLAEKKSLNQWRSLSRMSAHFLDMLQGLTTLKIFGRSKEQAMVIGRVSEAFRKNTMGVMRVAFLSAFVLEFMGMISTAIIAVSLGIRLINGSIPYAEALFILILAPEYYLPLRTLGLSFHARHLGTNGANRIYEVLEIQRDMEIGMLRGLPSKEIPLSGEPWLVFKEVGLDYENNGRMALNNIDFSLNYGERVALIGPSGSGKSSILQILMRFVEPTHGKVQILGENLSLIAPEKWREKVSYVPQKPYLFHGSILENLRFGKPQASFEEIVKAAQQAMAHQFIMELPQGYDTHIGEGGMGLSGGQAQRIAIARALLKDAPLLLLDEVSSGLDKVNERDLLIALEHLCQNRTVLFTTHRMETTLQADRILVIEEGRITEEGPPQELINKLGLYFLFSGVRGREKE